jgi:cytochrome P450
MQDAPTFNPFVADFAGNPHAIFHKLRAFEPVHFSPLLRAWIVTSHPIAQAMLSDTTRFSSRMKPTGNPQAAPDPVKQEIQRVFHSGVGLVDPPEHTRMRTLLGKAFTPKATERMRAMTQQFIDERINAVLPTGRCDIVKDLAGPLPMAVICKILGIPTRDEEKFARWTFATIQAISPTLSPEEFEEIKPLLKEILQYSSQLIDERRQAPGEDLLSAMIVAEEQGNKLTKDELLSSVVLLIAAGIESTTQAISLGVLSLLDHPEQLALLLAQPELIPQAAEETMRYEHVSVFSYRRVAQAVEVAGKQLQPDDVVLWSSVAINRDPAVFENPDKLDIQRGLSKAQNFGRGHHYCLGASLARMELEVGLGTIIRRLKNLRLGTDRASLQFKTNMLSRGLESLPVLFDPVA